jgi:hypothetical protein
VAKRVRRIIMELHQNAILVDLELRLARQIEQREWSTWDVEMLSIAKAQQRLEAEARTARLGKARRGLGQALVQIVRRFGQRPAPFGKTPQSVQG